MTKTTWTFAPAGVLGQGTAVARPYPGVVVCPTAAPVQGTGLPTAVRRRPDVQLVGIEVFAQAIAHNSMNDGTTLGNHTSRRPQS